MRIVIADDTALLREGAARLLEEAGHEVVAQAGDADDLLRKVRAHEPDVAVIDVRMPPDNSDDGLRAALTIRSELPEIGILLLSQYVEDRYFNQLVSGGAEGVGYLLKDRVTEVERLAEAVERVAAGGSVLDPEVVAQMLGRTREEDPLDSLTAREREVLGLMAEGRTNRSIAEALFLSERAVERHITQHLREARPAHDGAGPPPRARGARVSTGLGRGTTGVARCAWPRPHGSPGVPGDAQDDERDGEADQRIGGLKPESHDRCARDDGERDVGIRAGVVAVGDQRRAGESPAGAGADHRREPVPPESESAGDRERAEVFDVLRVDEAIDGLVAGHAGARKDGEHDGEAREPLGASTAQPERDCERNSGGCVARVVDQVREQRDRVRGDEYGRLRHRGHAQDEQREPDRAQTIS